MGFVSPTDGGVASASVPVSYIKGGMASPVPISLTEVGVASVPLEKWACPCAFSQSKGVAFALLGKETLLQGG